MLSFQPSYNRWKRGVLLTPLILTLLLLYLLRRSPICPGACPSDRVLIYDWSQGRHCEDLLANSYPFTISIIYGTFVNVSCCESFAELNELCDYANGFAYFLISGQGYCAKAFTGLNQFVFFNQLTRVQ